MSCSRPRSRNLLTHIVLFIVVINVIDVIHALLS